MILNKLKLIGVIKEKLLQKDLKKLIFLILIIKI